MDDTFWHEMLDLFFLSGSVSKSMEDNDLFFFVNNMKMHGYGFGDKMEGPLPFFVQRWVPALKKLINFNSCEIDWDSFLPFEFSLLHVIHSHSCNMQEMPPLISEAVKNVQKFVAEYVVDSYGIQERIEQPKKLRKSRGVVNQQHRLRFTFQSPKPNFRKVPC